VTDTLFVWIIAIIVWVLALLTSAVKASLSYTRLPFLLSLRDSHESAVDRTVALIDKPRLRTSLRIALVFFHFLLAGSVPVIMSIYIKEIKIWPVLFYVLLTMIVTSIMEYFLESGVLKAVEQNAIRLQPFGEMIHFFFSPLAGILMSILGPNANRATLNPMTEEDLKNWVEVGQPEGSLEKGEREMIYSIFQFGDTLAKDIMIPRIDVLALDITTTLGEARSTFIEAGHSRVPVYEDTVDNVVGLLYAKDLLLVQEDGDLIQNHRDILRLAYFVPEAKKVDELLAEMQSRSMHMAVVVDEYGGVAGLVTLEDIVEEIIGEIRDEYDSSEELPYEQVGPGEYIFQGKVDLDVFNEVMGTSISTENADTVGGFIYGEIGDVPEGGEILEADGVTLTVDEVIGRKISKIRASLDTHHHSEEDGKNVN
jgi:CBS domain containing-hemolysin-like protein